MLPRAIATSLEAFTQYLYEQGRAAPTITAYSQDIRLFAQWFEQINGEALTPPALTLTDARQYRQHLLQHKAAPATINRKLAALKAYAGWAVASRQIDQPPIAGLKGVDEQTQAPKWLDKKEQASLAREVERAVNAARSAPARRKAIRDCAIIAVLLHTGLRVSELCALELSDVSMTERKGLVVVREGKGQKRRSVPLNRAARYALQAWLSMRSDGPGSELPHVFIGKRGALESSGVQRLLAEYGRRAKVDVTPHTLRHTFAKNLVNAGVSLEKVAVLMGHSSLNTTRIYITPGLADLEQAVEALA